MAPSTTLERANSDHNSEKTARRDSQDEKGISDDASTKKGKGQDGTVAGDPARNHDFLRYDKAKWYVTLVHVWSSVDWICL
jgi:hypothetical protein